MDPGGRGVRRAGKLMRRLAGQEVLSGLLLVALGLAAAAIGGGYEVGDALAMGPGWMPFHLGLVLALLGAVIAVAGLLAGGEAVAPSPPGPVLAVVAGVMLFSLLAPRLGLLAGAFGAALPVARAGPGSTTRGAVLAAAGLTVATALVFVWLLRIPLPLVVG